MNEVTSFLEPKNPTRINKTKGLFLNRREINEKLGKEYKNFQEENEWKMKKRI